jgi:hypothetical protein
MIAMTGASALLLVLVAGQADVGWAPIPLSAARSMPTAELAARILPPEIAARVVAHETRESEGGGSYGVRFYAAPETAGGAICRRRTFYAVSSDFNVRGAEVQRAFPGVKIALAKDCTKIPLAGFASVQPETLEEGAVKALTWLADMQQRARRAGKLPVQVRCRSEQATNPCTAGALAVFAGLPLDKTYIIDKRKDAGDTERWQFSVMPTGPGQLFFTTMLTGSADKPEIELTWDAPAPF